MWQMISSRHSTTMNMTKTDNHILYHGTTVAVSDPLTHVGRPDLDFGPGFYLTHDREQAENWAHTKASRKKTLQPMLNVYQFDQEAFEQEVGYKTRIFFDYNQEWLDFIAYSRKGQQPWMGLDWIEGGIANDSVISTVDAYVDGIMPLDKALDKLVKEELRHQICISNQEIIDKYLRFVESIEL